jgi:uncharacterized membrane protein
MIYILIFALIALILLGIAVYQSRQNLKSANEINESLDKTEKILEKYINQSGKLEEELEKEYQIRKKYYSN